MSRRTFPADEDGFLVYDLGRAIAGEEGQGDMTCRVTDAGGCGFMQLGIGDDHRPTLEDTPGLALTVERNGRRLRVHLTVYAMYELQTEKTPDE